MMTTKENLTVVKVLLRKGGPGSGIKGHHTGPDPETSKGVHVTFDGKNGNTHTMKIKAMEDKHIERARAKIEAMHGKLPVDSRTNFPGFTIHHNGEEIGGG